MQKQEFFTRKASGLVRQLSASDALMFNCLYMALSLPFLFMVWTPVLYPGVNLIQTTLMALPFIFIIAVTFLFFAVSMPRAGGDFVWVSRTLHPAIAFMENFTLTIVSLSFIGFQSPMILDPGWKSILITWGTITGNSAMITEAVNLVNPVNLFIVGTVFIVIAILVVAAGTKTAFRVMWGCFAFVAASIVLYAFAMFTIGHDGFVTRFNALSGLNYSEMIQSAKSAGYNPGFTLTGMTLGIVYVFLNSWGFQGSAYVGGELKNVSRSQIVAIVGAVVLFAIATLSVYVPSYLVVGQEFLHSISFLQQTGNAAWTLPMAPYGSYLIAFATTNPWIAAIVGTTIIAFAFSQNILILLVSTRWIFSWSFDRVIPTAFSSVEPRFRVPRNALILCFVICMIFLYLTIFTTVLSFFAYGIVAVWSSAGIVGIAAAVFPYRRKDIFEKSPKMVQTKVAGIPVMTIFGVITAISGFFVAAAAIAPQFTGAPVNPYYAEMIVLIWIIALVVYGVAYWYNSRRGIDMHIGFKEIPPA
jgi:basic amino acid/polyamine antiporter, APA family